MLKDLYILGAGGFGREVAWLVERINEEKPTWNLKGFLDDNQEITGTLLKGYPVIGSCEFLADRTEEVWVVCAIGCAKTRKQIIEKVKKLRGVRFATLVDPSVLYSKEITIGEGSIVCAGTIITVNVEIGNHVIINLDCTIGHDARIEDFITIYPGVNISGGVFIGECAELGTGGQVIQGKKICAGSVIGAGAVVVGDIVEEGTYVGVPAKRLETKKTV